jgi:hypothetical protein
MNQLGGHTRVHTSTTHSETALLIFHSISLTTATKSSSYWEERKGEQKRIKEYNS